MDDYEHEDSNKVILLGHKFNRLLVTILLTVAVAICGALISRFDSVMCTVVFILLTIIFIVLQVLFSSYCASYDKQMKKQFEKMEIRNKVYKKLFEELPSLLNEQAAGLNKIAKNINEDGIIPSDRWTFDDATSYVCESIMYFLKALCVTGDTVNVYYVKRLGNDETKVKMVGGSNDLGETPSIFLKERRVTEDKTAYFDIKMFARNRKNAEFRLTSQEVDNVFFYNDREKEAGRIEQFLLIPVSCDRDIIIGLIEVIVPKGSKLAGNEQDMREIQKMLKIYAAIFVLLHKAEKAAIALPADADMREY